MVTPSQPSSSIACSSSASAPSTSGSGREAKWPKRSGWVRRIPAPASLTERLSLRAAASSPKWVPGEEMDSSAVAMPHSSMSSTCRAASQVGQPGIPSGCPWPAAVAASTWSRVRKWAWTSTSGSGTEGPPGNGAPALGLADGEQLVLVVAGGFGGGRGVVLTDQLDGAVLVPVGDRVDEGGVQVVAALDVLGQWLLRDGLHGEGVRLDDLQQAQVERPQHRVRADLGDPRVQRPVRVHERRAVQVGGGRTHAVELAAHRRQVLAPGVPEGVLDEQRVERVADADRVGDRCGVLVQGQHRVAEPDHGDWRLANRPPPGPGRTVTTPRDWTRRSASLNVPTETPHRARSSSLVPSRSPGSAAAARDAISAAACSGRVAAGTVARGSQSARRRAGASATIEPPSWPSRSGTTRRPQ